jgi:hypothetical protein
LLDRRAILASTESGPASRQVGGLWLYLAVGVAYRLVGGGAGCGEVLIDGSQERMAGVDGRPGDGERSSASASADTPAADGAKASVSKSLRQRPASARST